MTALENFGFKDYANYFIIDDEIIDITYLQMGVEREAASVCLDTLLSYFIKLKLSEVAAMRAFKALTIAVDDAFMFVQKGNFFYMEFTESIDKEVKCIRIVLEHKMLDMNKSALELEIVVVDGNLPDRETVS